VDEIDTFDAMLDPNDHAPGSWAIGAWDLYHAHVVAFLDPTGRLLDPAIQPLINSVRRIDSHIDQLRVRVSPRTIATVIDRSSLATQLFAILTQLATPLADLAASGSASLLYHSFESSTRMGGTTRYAGFDAADPRRRWLTSLPNGVPARYASADNPNNPDRDFFKAIELNFLVDKLGVVHCVAGTKEELVAITLEPYSTID
jgi:hypothetical protein